jgi:hypothetical protein
MKKTDFIIEADIARICENYAENKNISVEEAILDFMSSSTYKNLEDETTGLRFEMLEYIYLTYLEERGEPEEWVNTLK